jgi:regulatory protein
MMARNRIQKSTDKKISPQEALAKIRKYCAYQERSHQEVKNKLFEFGLYSNEVEEITARLITEGFLNEERFAKAFAGGKFRMQKWGRNKIIYQLEGRGLTKTCIQRGLREIEETDYRKTLTEVILKKTNQIQENNLFKKRERIARYTIARGYEPELVWVIVKELVPD